MSNHPSYETTHWQLSHSHAFLVPGYLFVESKAAAWSLTDLPAEAMAELGPLLQLAVKAVEAVLKPENVYCARFGEWGGCGTLHFHILPRTAWLTRAYQHEFPDAESISGPVLLDWVSRAFYRGDPKVPHEGSMAETETLLREFMEGAAHG